MAASFLPIALATVIAVASYPAQATTPEADFAARCAAPGVVLCKGLDTASDIAANIQPAGDGTIQGSLDTTTKTSGAGSLRFTLRAGVTDTNIGGAWEVGMNHNFVSGETMYVQFALRIDANYLSNAINHWNSSIKYINLHGPSSTCQGAEWTTIWEDQRLVMYTNCGDGINTLPGSTTVYTGTSGDILLQQANSFLESPSGDGYNCHYQNQFSGTGDGSGCFWVPADTWVTVYEIIHLGTFGGNTSTVDAFVSINGGPYKQFHRVTGVEFANTVDNFFSRARLETYMTELTTGHGGTVDAHCWYDELIVSTEPIAVPGATGDGDLNADGTVDVLDVLLAEQISLSSIPPSATQLAHGDINGDGVINVADVLMIQRKALGLVNF
ncbi:MAG: dockerin type I domain-containing protein [Sulfuricaulis sp.]